MSVGKLLILVGIVFLVVGVLWWLGEKVGLGRLPGDIVIRSERSVFYFPLATSIVLSVLLSLVLWFVQRLEQVAHGMDDQGQAFRGAGRRPSSVRRSARRKPRPAPRAVRVPAIRASSGRVTRVSLMIEPPRKEICSRDADRSLRQPKRPRNADTTSLDGHRADPSEPEVWSHDCLIYEIHQRGSISNRQPPITSWPQITHPVR